MARRYDMRKRGRAAAGTRAQIIHAAHGLLNQRDGGGLTVHQVAGAAGVSRAAIYKSVGPRRELLAAVFEDQGRLIGYNQVLAAMRLPDAALAIVTTVRESARAWSVIPDAIRTTLALAAIDAEVGGLVDQYERYRRGEMAALARRAMAAGVIKRTLGANDAAVTLALLTGFPAFDHLRREHSVTAATRHLVRMVTASLGMNPH